MVDFYLIQLICKTYDFKANYLYVSASGTHYFINVYCGHMVFQSFTQLFVLHTDYTEMFPESIS